MASKTILNSIKTPSPCSADWNEMIGGEQTRFCQSCEKNVYNLSAMPRREARKLVAHNAGKICVRYVRLPNADTKLYKITGRASRLAAGVLGASLTLAAMANAQAQTPAKSNKQQIDKTQKKVSSKTSQISFTIYDPTGEVIPNEEVKLTNKKTGEEFTAYTNQAGVAQFSLIPHGTYDFTAGGNGFEKYQQTFQIKELIELNIKIRLNVGAATGEFVFEESEIPLFQAIAQGDSEVVKQQINSGFNINTKDKSGQTALHVAVEYENLEIIHFLLVKGAKVNIKNKEKYTPLLLLEESLSELDDENKTTLEILRLLIAKGADVNAQNDTKETLLTIACSDENLEVARILLEAGANPNLKNEDDETALQQTDSEEIKQLLRQYGARE